MEQTTDLAEIARKAREILGGVQGDGVPRMTREVVVKGSNAVGATVEFYAAVIRAVLEDGDAREAQLLERLRIAEEHIGTRLGMAAGGPYQRHGDALRGLVNRGGPAAGSALSDDESAALRYVLGLP